MTRPALALAAAFVLTGATAVAAPLAVQEVRDDQTTAEYEIQIGWPATGVPAIDGAIGGWVAETRDDFALQAQQDYADFRKDNNQAPPWSYSLYLTYEVARNDDMMFVADFQENIFTGGAHPNHFPVTFNFLRPDGWRVYLPEIFDGSRALARISQIAVADLTRQLTGPDSMSDPDWIRGGAGPNWSNFNAFVLLPDRLVLRFAPYQVAAYAAGEQLVEIPLAELAGLMRSDWRAPAPSFDCAKAGTAVERAICASVPLARLDRDVASAYATALQYASDDAAKESLRREQRAWLSARNAACANGAILCLTGVYQARLKALQPG